MLKIVHLVIANIVSTLRSVFRLVVVACNAIKEWPGDSVVSLLKNDFFFFPPRRSSLNARQFVDFVRHTCLVRTFGLSSTTSVSPPPAPGIPMAFASRE